MIRVARLWLMVVTLLAGIVLVAACGGDDDDGDTEEPAATEVTDEEEEAEGDEEQADEEATEEPDADEEDADEGDAGASFEDIPLPSGAEETESGSYSASDIPFFVPSGEVDPEAFTSLEFKLYDVDDAPEDVIDFYQDELGDDWTEVFVASGGAAGDAGGFGVWTRDDGNTALWVGTSVVDDTTQLTVILGSTG